jgi:hypothetical protein
VQYGTKYRVCFCNMKSERKTNKTNYENILQNIVHERRFPELTSEKAKLKTKTIRAGNSVRLIKSERIIVHINDISMPKIFWLKQALSFLHGFCISRPSVTTEVKKHINLYISLKEHVHCVYECVSTINYHCACRGYVPLKCFKIILCCVIRRQFPLK